MTTLNYLHRLVIPAAYALLPAKCNSREATAFLLAIALQESAVEYRVQFGGGPGRSWYQFERAGIAAVLMNPTSRVLVGPAIDTLQYPAVASALHVAAEHNDILATVFARALLWTVPAALPKASEADLAYGQYVASWRPGRPRPETWSEHYAHAWEVVAT